MVEWVCVWAEEEEVVVVWREAGLILRLRQEGKEGFQA